MKLFRRFVNKNKSNFCVHSLPTGLPWMLAQTDVPFETSHTRWEPSARLQAYPNYATYRFNHIRNSLQMQKLQNKPKRLCRMQNVKMMQTDNGVSAFDDNVQKCVRCAYASAEYISWIELNKFINSRWNCFPRKQFAIDRISSNWHSTSSKISSNR